MFTHIILAQDLDDIKKMTYLGKTKDAKDMVDKFLAVEKNAKKPDGWYFKGIIYDKASKDSSKTLQESSELKSVSYQAFKKYRELDTKATLLAEDNNSYLFDLYVGFSSEIGVKAYSAKNVETAFDNFKKALEVHDYIFANNITGNNGFKFFAIDTTLTFYTAIAGVELKKDDEAAVFYKKLTDAGVSEEQYINAYQFLAEYYKNKKDKAAFAEIVGKGAKLYPKNEYWAAIEIEEETDGLAKQDLFKKFDELLGKYPGNYTLAYNYAVELYRFIISDEMKNENTDIYKVKFPEVMKKAIDIKSTSEGNFLMASFLYNNSVDLSEEARKIRGPKPEDLKRKKEVEAHATEQMNQAIPYCESVINLFAGIAKPKLSEKVNYKQVLGMLKSIYEVKKDASKVATYTQKLKEAE
jgi:hypothetical protein